MNAGAFLLSAVIVGCSVYAGAGIALAHEGHNHGLEAAVDSVTSIENTDPDATADYWNDDQMRAAKPLPIGIDGRVDVEASADMGAGTNPTTDAPGEPVEAYGTGSAEADAEANVGESAVSPDAPEVPDDQEEVGFFAGIYLSIKSWFGF